VFLLDYIADIVAPRSEDPKLIIGVITLIFAARILLVKLLAQTTESENKIGKLNIHD